MNLKVHFITSPMVSRKRRSPSIIEIAKALKTIDRETQRLNTEKVSISNAVGRVLAEDIIADSDLPPFDRSQMDGFAVVAAETLNAPVNLKIVGESAAGRGWHKAIKNGEAVRIMTGAPVPRGADAVQKVELTRETGGLIEIVEPVKPEFSIVRRGTEIKKGTVIFKSGEIVTENMIAAIASFGYAKIKAGKRPRVAILGTGSEIVEIAKTPGPDQIRNSNSVMLEVMCRRAGADPVVLPNAKDDITELRSRIKAACRNADILILTGGVSVGKYDHTKAALNDLSAELFFEKVRLKPGKPGSIARLGKTLVFGLPGNPVSAAVTFHLFVRRSIMSMQDASNIDHKTGFAVMKSTVQGPRERDSYLPGRLTCDKNGVMNAEVLQSKGSSDFESFSRSNILIVIPRGTSISENETVRVVFL